MSMYIYIWRSVQLISFHLALFNLVLGLMSMFIEIQDVQMMNGIYGDLTLYGHATIIGDNKSIYRPVTICVQASYISFCTALRVYKARFYNIL